MNNISESASAVHQDDAAVDDHEHRNRSFLYEAYLAGGGKPSVEDIEEIIGTDEVPPMVPQTNISVETLLKHAEAHTLNEILKTLEQIQQAKKVFKYKNFDEKGPIMMKLNNLSDALWQKMLRGLTS